VQSAKFARLQQRQRFYDSLPGRLGINVSRNDVVVIGANFLGSNALRKGAASGSNGLKVPAAAAVFKSSRGVFDLELEDPSCVCGAPAAP
jgi:hypothetical protein